MVYSVRADRPIVSKTQLKTKRVQSENSKQLSAYVKNHKISIQTYDDGKVRVSGKEINHG